MVATVVISGSYALQDTAGIDAFLTANLGGAAGDVVATYQDINNKGVWIICSKA